MYNREKGFKPYLFISYHSAAEMAFHFLNFMKRRSEMQTVFQYCYDELSYYNCATFSTFCTSTIELLIGKPVGHSVHVL